MLTDMILAHPHLLHARVLVDDAVVEGVMAHRQLALEDPEAGGILLGLRRGDHLHITALTTPKPRDVRHRVEFRRRDKFHQAQALALWHRSGGVVDYMGEWHSHPEPEPSPSRLDLSEWRAICAYQLKPMVFVIAGTRTSLWTGVGDTTEIRRAPALAPA
jgi:integrative and conjugative element protein (TIGR02256 family)